MRKQIAWLLSLALVMGLWLPAVSAAPAEEAASLVLLPANFSQLGTWAVKADGKSNGGSYDGNYLVGFQSAPDKKIKPEEAQPAIASVDLPADGTYYVWARSRDFPDNGPGNRHFQIQMGETLLPTKLGAHGNKDYDWALAGSVDCKKGKNLLGLIDTSVTYPRTDVILLTTDANFIPSNDLAEIKKLVDTYGLKAEDTAATETAMPGGQPVSQPADSGMVNVQVKNKLGQAVMLFVGKETAYIKGQRTLVDQSNKEVIPFVTDKGRTLVPVRFIAESFGAQVGFEDATQTVTIQTGNKTVRLILGQNEMDVNGTKQTLDEPANTYHDRTFIPLRAMAEAIGKSVFWDDRGLILISDYELFDSQKDQALITQAVNEYGGIMEFTQEKEYVGTVAGNDYRLNDQYDKELIPRNGLDNSLSKLKAGGLFTVAYIGGSITQQSGWRPKTTAWLKAQFPKAEIQEVNIAASGTNADLGACRIGSEVLPENPDLIFIEYAVNGGTPEQMEGMVRQAWKHDPKTDICLIYTTNVTWYDTFSKGGLPPVMAGFETVADHYGIPAVFFPYQIFDLYDQGKLTLKSAQQEGDKLLFSTDGIHPTENVGGLLNAGAVARSFVSMDKEAPVVTEHPLPAPLCPANWENAKAVGLDKAKFTGSWTDYTNDPSTPSKYGPGFDYTGGYLSLFKQMFPSMKGTQTAGDSVTIRFRGTQLAILEAGGPYSGQLKVIVDGVELQDPLVLYNVNCTKLRHQYRFLPVMEEGEHTVTFILDSQMPDKSAQQKANPSDPLYQRNELYFGKFLMVGDVLEIKN